VIPNKQAGGERGREREQTNKHRERERNKERANKQAERERDKVVKDLAERERDVVAWGK
jgi:hypothetical protein